MSVEHVLLAADHDGERSGDSARFSAGDGCVQERDALGLAGGGDLLGARGRNRAHVDDHGTLRRPFQDSVFAENGGFGVGGVGHHRDDDRSGGGDFSRR